MARKSTNGNADVRVACSQATRDGARCLLAGMVCRGLVWNGFDKIPFMRVSAGSSK